MRGRAAIAEDLSRMSPRKSGKKLSSFLQSEDCGLGSIPGSPSAEEVNFALNNPQKVAATAPWSPISPYAMSPWSMPRASFLEGGSFGCIASMVRQDGHVYAIAADGELLYTGSESKNIRVWKYPSFEEYGCLKSGSGSVKALLVVGERIFSAHRDHKIRVWERSHGRENYRRLATLPTLRGRIQNGANPRKYVQVRRHRKCVAIEHVDIVSCLASDVERGLLYSGSWDKTVKVWRMSDFKCLESINAHDDAVNCVAVGHDGSLFTGSTDGAVKMWTWNPAEGRHVLRDTLRAGRQPSAVNALAVGGSGGHTLYAGLSDGAIQHWDDRKECGSIHGHKLAILCLATASGLLFSGSADKTVGIWRRDASGLHSRLAVLEGHDGPVKCIATSVHFGICLVYTGGLDRSVRIWSVPLDRNPDDDADYDFTRSPVLSPAWVLGKLSA